MFDIYVRVSEVAGREGDSFGSPQEQEAAARAWAEREGIEVGEVVTELDVSGGIRADDRQLGRLIKKIEDGDSDGLIVRYIDRFGRDMIENALAHDRIVAAGGRLVATASGYDSANLTPDTRMVFNIQSAIAQAQREKNRDARLAGSRRAVERGVYLAPCAPFGYLRREEVEPEYNKDGTLKRDGVLVFDPVRSKLVPGIFEKRAEHWTLAAIREWLSEEGVEITAEGIRSIIKNRAYLGESKKPTAVKGRPEVIKNAHPALVSEDLWERANATSNGRDCRNTGRLSAQVRLSGIVYCSSCGRRLKTGGCGQAGESRYTCTHADCPSRVVIKASDLDAFVRGVLSDAFLSYEPHIVAIMEGDDRYERALEAVKEAAAERDHWRDEVSVLKTGEDNWTRGLEAREAALGAARKALREIPDPRAAQGKPDSTPVTFEEALPALDREHIARFVSRVVVRPVGRGRRVPAGERAEVWLVGAEEPLDVTTVTPVGDPEVEAILAAAHEPEFLAAQAAEYKAELAAREAEEAMA
jgi:DNA invertase Pin-like site-specific DNA recombinase